MSRLPVSPTESTEAKREYLRAYRATHREIAIAYALRYYREHPEKWARSDKQKQKHVVTERTAYNENPARKAKTLASAHAYFQTHKEQCIFSSKKHRALELANTPPDELLTLAQWRDVLDAYQHRCAYCGRKSAHLTVDHVIPVSRGGKHTKNNVVPACKSCNCSKQAKTPEERFGLAVCNG